MALVVVPGCKSEQPTTTIAGSPAPSKSAASPAAVGEYGAVSNDRSYYVSYTPKPNPIPLNQMFELTVWVAEPQEHTRSVPDVSLHVDAAMPQHDHGMNTRPQVRRNADGSFNVSGMLFHMPGHWELYCDVTRNGVTERAQFDVELE